MKLLLCKVDKEPEVVELPKDHDYHDLKKLLEISSPLTVVERKIGDKYYDLWIDDEGLFKEPKYLTGCCLNANEILCGNILIVNHGDNGETTGLSEDDIMNILWKGFLPNGNKNVIALMNDEVDDNGDIIVSKNYAGWGIVYANEKGYCLRYEY